MRWMILTAMLVGVSSPTTVTAQDTNGFRAITAGNLVLAEKELAAQRREFPARPELMLNLANVYAKTARPDEARALYRDVLARRDVAMDMPDGSVVTSHALAKLGLTRLGDTTLAAR